MLNKLIPLIGIQFIAAALVILNSTVPQAPLSPSLYFDPLYVYAWLNTIFLLPAGVAVAYISSRAFKSAGHLSIQLMGCGTTALCFATLSTWAGTTEQDIAFYYAMLDLFGILVGSVFLAAGVTMTYRAVVVAPAGRSRVIITTYLLLGIVGVLIWAAGGRVPPFFSASSQTAASVDVLLAGGALFSVSSILLGRTYLATRSEILYWYVVAVLLVLTSIVTDLFIRHPGDPISWLYRATTFLYAGAFFNAVLKSRIDEDL